MTSVSDSPPSEAEMDRAYAQWLQEQDTDLRALYALKDFTGPRMDLCPWVYPDREDDDDPL